MRKIFLVIYLAYVGFLTLSPFRFRSPQMYHFPWPLGSLRWDLSDLVVNIILFLPFGFIMALLLETKTPFRRGIQTMWMSGGVSLVIETLQIIIQGRYPSFLDILTNTLGGYIGFVMAGPSIKRLAYLNHTTSLSPRLQTIFMVLLLGDMAFLFCLPFSWGKSFSGWDRGVTLLIGNSPEKTDPWHGEILSLAVYPYAIERDQIQRHYHKGYRSFRDEALLHDPLALYTFEQSSGVFRDDSLIKPPLDLRRYPVDPEQSAENRAASIGRHGVVLAGSTLLMSSGSGSKIYEPIDGTQELTVEVWIYPRPQSGPGGRIVSLVQGERSLFYLHQDWDEITMGLREGFFRRGHFHSEGIETMLLMPHQDHPMHIVGVYNQGRISIFVNGEKVGHGFLTNGFFVLFNFLNLDRMPFGGRGLLGLALFWPLGLLLSLSHKNRSPSTWMIYGLLGGCFIGLLMVIHAQHPALFFGSHTVWVPILAQILGMMTGEYIKRYRIAPRIKRSDPRIDSL